jgi:hypothetical protein
MKEGAHLTQQAATSQRPTVVLYKRWRGTSATFHVLLNISTLVHCTWHGFSSSESPRTGMRSVQTPDQTCSLPFVHGQTYLPQLRVLHSWMCAPMARVCIYMAACQAGRAGSQVYGSRKYYTFCCAVQEMKIEEQGPAGRATAHHRHQPLLLQQQLGFQACF